MKALRRCWPSKGEIVVKATPLPKRKVLVSCIVNFSNQFGSLVIFPFLPFMISDFFPHLGRTEIGKKAGFLGSAYFIGSFAGSLLWGWLADIIGRRPAMLLGLCGTIFSITLFGFSQNFAWAVCTRLIWGLLNGNIGVIKTYMSEVCDDTNQAKGFSLIATMAGVGRMLGSVTGGFLARPASKYPLFDVPFFCHFPYLLPCLVALVVAIIGLFSGWLFLDETLKKSSTDKKQLEKDSEFTEFETDSMVTVETELSDDSMVTINGQVIEDSEDDDMEQLLGSHDPSLHNSHDPVTQANWRTEYRELFYDRLYCCHGCSLKGRSFKLTKKDLTAVRDKLVTMAKLMMDRRVVISTSLYGLLGFIAIITNEVFPLLMVTDHRNGGYNMDDSTIGIFLTIAASCQLSYQILLYPRFAKLLGYRNSFRAGLVMLTIGCILMPLANQISGPVGSSQSNNSSNSSANIIHNVTVNDTCHHSRLELLIEDSTSNFPIRVWITVSWLLTMIVIARANSFTCVMVLIANSTLSTTRGTVNGIGQSLVAVGRSIGPLIGAPLFAWSASNGHGWPLNHHFVYDSLVVMIVITMAISFALPKSSEKKRLPKPVEQNGTTDPTVINMINR